jgi:NAD(P)-dependent dehydrogenase (short-subunit alcohol dehydrogenase family)
MTDPRTYAAPAELLRERVILVTGAGRGIGRAAALAFAAHGATVVLHGRDEDRLAAVYDEIEAAGAPKPAAVPLDFETAGAREFDALAGAIEQAVGRLDGILHSAVHLERLALTETIDLAAWTRLMRVNFTAPLALTRACLHLLRRAPDAAVIYTSDSHVGAPSAFWASVAAPKAALLETMRVQADEWAQHPNLRVNAVVPGPVASPARTFTHPGAPLASLPPPEAILPAYLWLIGPASRGVSGRIVACQG